MVSAGLVRNLVLTCAIAGAPLVVTPAHALDDGKGNTLLDVLDIVGLGEKKEEPYIQYRERAPLVLPPKSELRQPLPPAAERSADWPRDPEAVRAAKRAQENRLRREEFDERDPHMAGKLTRQGRINPADAKEHSGPEQACSMVPDSPNRCDPTTLWKNLAVKSDTPASRGLQAGVEPDRQYLTQPPKGYMAPKKSMAATVDAPQQPVGVFDYFRQKPKEE